MNWKEAVTFVLRAYTRRHATAQVDRRKFLDEELSRILELTKSTGKTPAQTVSRVLQELRDEGFLFFSSAGKYVLTDMKFDVAAEDAPEDVIENAARCGELVLKDVDVSDVVRSNRVRQGISALRRATLSNYGHTCALCDVRAIPILVTSHVARWADRPEARGLLSNTICFCSLHDSLFEHGYFSLDDSLQVLLRHNIQSESISTWLKKCTHNFNKPPIEPSRLYLRDHRERVGLNQN